MWYDTQWGIVESIHFFTSKLTNILWIGWNTLWLSSTSYLISTVLTLDLVTISSVLSSKSWCEALWMWKQLPCICRESSLHFMAMPTTEGVRSNGIQCMWKVLGLKTLKNVNVHSINPMNLPLLLISQPLSISNNKLMNTFFFMTWTSMLHQVSSFYPRYSCYNNLLGNFIFQNYHQALEWIQTSSECLGILTSKLSTTSKDCEVYLTSECKYLQDLCVEPPEVVKRANYIDHLTKLYHLQ